ncbi:MAG: hypothetical protein ACTSRR_04340 [Candidatus Heimdallarchaeaceae archaeon]
MEKKSKTTIKKWISNLDIRKLSFRGKLIIIISFLLISSAIIINYINNFQGKIVKYSVWILFGWFFLIIIFYISIKLLSFTVLRNKQQKLKEEIESDKFDQSKD